MVWLYRCILVGTGEEGAILLIQIISTSLRCVYMKGGGGQHPVERHHCLADTEKRATYPDVNAGQLSLLGEESLVIHPPRVD
jgi:hypothetical protein